MKTKTRQALATIAIVTLLATCGTFTVVKIAFDFNSGQAKVITSLNY